MLTAMAVIAIAAVSAQAANLIVNGDFELGDKDNTPFDGPGWSASGLWQQDDDNVGTGAYVYSWGASVMPIDQTVSDPWTTASTIDISLTTAFVSWGSAANGHSVVVELFKASGGAALWSSSTVGSTSTAVIHDWSIDASTLAATEGEDLNLKIGVLGNGTLIDDVTLSVTAAAVPEPSTTALLGLGGLALILRRRK
jgi:hypothetical protein